MSIITEQPKPRDRQTTQGEREKMITEHRGFHYDGRDREDLTMLRASAEIPVKGKRQET